MRELCIVLAVFVGLVVSLAGCTCSGVPAGTDTGPVADTSTRPDSGVADSGTRDAHVTLPDTSTGSDAGADAGADAGVEDVRFVVMGDVGEGNTDQRAVAVTLRDYCAANGCDFVLLLGDNIYNSGVDSVTDPQWNTKFEEPYRDIMLPFYAVLGNHDYGGVLGLCPACTERGGLGNEFHLGPIEVAYTAVSMRWTMPDTFYTTQLGNVGFVMLDTNSILWDNTENGDQEAWIAGAIADLRADGAEWIIAAGHHPYLSNGAHGNAGRYETIEIGDEEVDFPLIPQVSGTYVLEFFNDHVCGNVDLYFAGHDHNRQWIDEPGECGGTELIVSGAGAKVKGFDSDSRNALHYGDETVEGFFYIHIRGDTLTGRSIDMDGTVAFERVTTRLP